MNNSNYTISREELADALTTYISGKIGIIDEITPVEAGRTGAYICELKNIGLRYSSGEITEKELKEETIEQTVNYIISPSIDKIIEKSLDKVIEILEKFERIKPIVKLLKVVKPVIKIFIKDKILKKTKEVASKAWNYVKTNIKKIWSKR